VTTEVEHLLDLDVILLLHTGHVSAEELQQAGEKAFALAMESGTWRFLSDCTELTWTHTLVEQLGQAELLQSMGITGDYRQAVLRPRHRDAAATVVTRETVSVNRGIRVRVVADREARVVERGLTPRPSASSVLVRRGAPLRTAATRYRPGRAARRSRARRSRCRGRRPGRAPAA